MKTSKARHAKHVHIPLQLTPVEAVTVPATELPRDEPAQTFNPVSPNPVSPVVERLSTALFVWLAFVLSCNILQPWQLGFYLDDWSMAAEIARHGAAFSSLRFHDVLAIDVSRPVLALIRFVLSSMLGEDPLAWQSAMLLSNIAIALMLWRFLNALSGGRSSNVNLAVAATWLILPWSAAYRFWCVLLPVNFVVLFFAWLAKWILEQWKRSRGPWLIPAIGFAGCCLSYEAFYLQFIPVLLLGTALVRSQGVRWRHVLYTGAGMALGQGMALGWRFYGPTTPGMVRPMRVNWLALYRESLHRLPVELGGSVKEVMPVLMPLAILAVGAVLAVVVRMFIKRSRQSLEQLGLSLLACIVGTLLGILTYAAGGIVVEGMGSRTLLFFSVWTVVAASGCAAAIVAAVGSLRIGKVTQVLAFGLGMLLAAAYVCREQNWAAAWRKQQRYLSQAPVAAMAHTEPNARIVYVGPFTVNEAPVFSASWDLNKALPMTYPILTGKSFIVYNPWMGPMIWDGAKLSYGAEAVAQNQSVYLWAPEENRFFRATEPVRINQDLTIVGTSTP
jgi:hypothetical protein